MFSAANLFVIVFFYLILLFILAYYAEKKEGTGKSIVNNPYIYSLSLAVYCTSWTFYGSVGKAATSGLSFITTYTGPTLMAALWPVLLIKVIRLAKTHRITTISDFISSRYGKSLFLSGLVTVVAVVGITPYIGLQIKAIISTFSIISGETKASTFAGLIFTGMLGVFAIIFGARRLDSSERHGGLVFAIAFESMIKLIAFIFVGLFVTYGLFDGIGDILRKIEETEHAVLLYLGRTDTDYSEWFALTFLSMMAIMLLPRQFQMAVVENYSESHVKTASWLFPLYLFLINIFVIPTALGGLLLGGDPIGADYFVLSIPLEQGNKYLSLFVFLGGFSAATGMVIVEALALSTMVMNSLVMPAVIRFHEAEGFARMVLNIKRIVIMIIVFLGYLFAISIGEFYSLVDIGLKSFEAVTLFAPAFFLGLYWKRATKIGAIAGITGGFIIWFYTLIIPALLRAGLIMPDGLIGKLIHSAIFNPHALFGIEGLGKWGHSLLWSMLINLLLFTGVSVFTRQSRDEELQALVFVESYEKPGELGYGGPYSVESIENILSRYLGKEGAERAIEEFLLEKKKNKEELNERELLELRNHAERVLSGAIGPSIASIIFENKHILTEKERAELSESIKNITESLRLSKQELTEALKELSYLKEFSENIIESAPVGIITIDSSLNVKYWNREMESLTGIPRKRAINTSLTELIPWLKIEEFNKSMAAEKVIESPLHQTFRINISPFKDPSGGHVIIFEDITEKKRMEEQLLQTSKLASIGKLTAGISHEIGNPLASISSLVQELLTDKPDEKFIEEALITIKSHIERIAKIVRSLSDFARISSSEKKISSLEEILQRTVNLVKYDKRFKNIKLNIDTEQVPDLFLNPDQIQQVFLNLFLNSMDAMPDGGTINISIKKKGPYVEISFSDSGTGIDDSIIDRVFDPFFTTKPSGKGTGLGLSICYGIIKDHNGSISVRSKKGKGTTFLIRLPLHSV
ncbi:MAG: ATP-binding protein [Thermodesulfovibrionales bacterium]|nr:ATP-binding protein [Thermodesulfovibrionales bacterium]